MGPGGTHLLSEISRACRSGGNGILDGASDLRRVSSHGRQCTLLHIRVLLLLLCSVALGGAIRFVLPVPSCSPAMSSDAPR